MLDSWLSQLAFSAVAVTALALVLLLRARDHAHKALPGGAARWVRAAEAAALAGVGGAGVAVVLGAGPGAAELVGAMLGGSVMGWAWLRPGRRIAAVAAWGSGSVAAATGLVWLVASVVSAPWLVPALLLLALGALVVWGLISSRGWAPAMAAGPGRRTLLALAAAVAPALAAVAVVSSVQAPPSPRAGASDTGPGTPPGSAGPGAPGETWSPSAPAGTTGPTETSPPASGSGQRNQATQGLVTPTTSPTTGSGDPATTTPTTPTPGATPTETVPTTSPTTSPAPEPTKTPGYEKDNPNRPSDAPSPGGGRPD